MDKNKEFYELMKVINGVFDKMQDYEKEARCYGTDDLLYTIEVHTLDIIGTYDNITSSEIAAKMYKTKGAVCQTVDKLEKKGLIKKDMHDVDTRKKVLMLTEKGKIVYNYHKQKDIIAYNRYLERLENYTCEDFERSKNILVKIFKLDKEQNK
ncbi:MarR family winged helix-turn-helix transcriptional regulator [Acetobacterium woodii]|uniref:Transcriptional regulator MarR family n=1 Tax=Acetobacterium woodii (strain ATCC 29683 / DSM 1030 / JCM 2381 / KCTC 1655 / WB1) TaxID=931626 RepID=H6LBN6_ACEWD|nr:MarR family transcriptional regulator [Acetobacterium woodii]AFA50159.1 transcriptional regulator MarR family [Acetobacterium woodii DSM 1030]